MRRMDLTLRSYRPENLPEMIEIWNQVVEQGDSFPQDTPLDAASAQAFFAAQTDTVCALDEGGRVVGLYILHPNSEGRCGHVANCSYAVKADRRGQKIGRRLVEDSLKRAREAGFLRLQYNAVVVTNERAIALYEKLGFTCIGRVPKAFRARTGEYRDTYIFNRAL
ncbi:L-amino acid N-acyltransferase YncA [Bittarella massiliensis (ex Durand et al. 2017)]|uniref:L-amino acid N-acyltransferase YncA n=2 Tax=Bittarella massiliensis (ex Durand et al. 2017) TaxID=1720313 RepID=A0AAQ1MCZ5_9FIRM|nr:acetyltransferase, GNAT family [Clostridium sp. ATCC 29733]SHF86695.1 L-amino acid N-acyltransferase YncA [Bittarella massiliensis (ex Durand et al. 2017)]